MSTRRNILHRMFIITHYLKKEFKDIVAQYNLSEMEAKFMFHIGRGHDKTSDLITHFSKHKSTITQKTKSLEEKGFIHLKSAKNDKRERYIAITKLGKQFCNTMNDMEIKFHERVFKKFSKNEAEQLSALLNKLDITIPTQTNHETIC